MYTEHKPYEPAFYSSVNNDWGTSLLLAQGTGDRAKCLVDLGHHLPNTNIEQVVSRLAMVGRLGGFHFNDSKYGDDDLTVGSITPFQLFLIVGELLEAGGGRMPDARLHDRREPQPEGPARGPDPGHRRHPGARWPRRCASTGPTWPTRSRPTIPPGPPRCCTAGSAPTCGRWWPRPAGATAPPSTRSPPTGPSATAAATVASRGSDAVATGL